MLKHFAASATVAVVIAAAGFASAQPAEGRSPLLVPAAIHFYVWEGRRYCWYDDGWNGPGWYWCGYPWRRGFGWGGPWEWNGWVGGHPRGWYREHGWRGHDHGGHWRGAHGGQRGAERSHGGHGGHGGRHGHGGHHR